MKEKIKQFFEQIWHAIQTIFCAAILILGMYCCIDNENAYHDPDALLSPALAVIIVWIVVFIGMSFDRNK